MKVSYELKQGYIDVWNEENEEWDRYIKVNKKSVTEEEKKIPEKLSTWFSVETKQSKELNIEYANTNFENMYEKINEIIDCLEYLKSKGE